jgi:hypothetical protein
MIIEVKFHKYKVQTKPYDVMVKLTRELQMEDLNPKIKVLG